METTELYQDLEQNEILSIRSYQLLLPEVPDKELNELIALDRFHNQHQMAFIGISPDNPLMQATLYPISFLQSLPRDLKQQAACIERRNGLKLKRLCLESILMEDHDVTLDSENALAAFRDDAIQSWDTTDSSDYWNELG